jgi:hypothetical protein
MDASNNDLVIRYLDKVVVKDDGYVEYHEELCNIR